jgi:glutathione synthase/RimK-type ligase-like ATP-grasp enzyme
MDLMAGKHHVAFVTCAAVPNLSSDDRLALPALARRGIQVTPVIWDDPAIAWDRYDLVVIRSTWDYTRRIDSYRAWLEHMQHLRAPLWNPPAVARWNSEKTYLRELAHAGVPVVPTRWVQPGERGTLRQLLSSQGWQRAVIKPVVSANGQDTWAVAGPPSEADEERFRRAARDSLMVQPLIDDVFTEGEWSLVFFAGAFSHALLKRPAHHDFRVQEDYGGRTQPALASSELIESARHALSALPGPALYARVDGVRSHGRFVLMELELLEPSFFFAAAPPVARESFADAVLRTIKHRSYQTA